MTAGRLNRRAFLARAGRMAAAAGVAGFVSLDPLAAVVSAAGPLRKCISLGGPGSLRMDGHPDDYLLWGNREFIRDLSGTTWVKLWVSWYDLQQELAFQPASRAASWRHLNTAPAGQSWLRRLDRQVRAVNDDGLGVILSLYHTYPTWSSGATGPNPVDSGKAAEQKLPLDVSTTGPWAWFIGYLVARYRRGAAPNPTGPHDPAPGETPPGYDARFGNPDGASIDALEICNEPNYLGWPQEGVANAVAEMVVSSTQLSATWGGTPVLAPGTSDFPDATRRNSLGTRDTVWSEFTLAVLTTLAGYRSPVPLRWSHHNYRDVRLGETRAESVLEMLAGAGWSSDVAPLWLTEGGLNLASRVADQAQREFQARAIERSFRLTMRLPDVYLWTQHTISDKAGNSFKSGLRDDFTWGQGIGPERPSWFAWRALPGAPLP
jgi:hypothetical protein